MNPEVFTSMTGAFATIVGLLCNFQGERSGTTLKQFIDWLKEKHHDDVAAAIERDRAISAQLQTLLTGNHQELIERLSKLDLMLSSVAGQMDEFSGLAKCIYPELQLSGQAISIVRQLIESGAKALMEVKMFTGDCDEYCFFDGGTGNLKYSEPRFIEDDLLTLVQFGLLRPDFGSKGSRQFKLTRSAVAFIDSISK
jgi:hypothetical protein